MKKYWERKSEEEEIKLEATIPVQARVDITTLCNLDIYWLGEKHGIKSLSQLVSWSLDLLLDILKENGHLEGHEVIKISDAYRYMNERGLMQRGVMKYGREKLATAMRFEALREEGIDPKEYTPRHYNMIHNSHTDKTEMKPRTAYDPVASRDYLQRMRNGLIPENEMLGNWRNLAEALKNRKRSREEIEKYRDRFSENSGIDKEKLIIPETADEELERAKKTYREQGMLAEEPVRVPMRPQDNIVSGIVLGKPMSEEQAAERMKEIEERDKKIKEIENSEPDIEWMKSQGLIVKEKKDNSIIEETQSASAHCSTDVNEDETITNDDSNIE